MDYKSYTGRVEFDEEAGLFCGQVINTRDVLTFRGRSAAELQQALKDTVEDYLKCCKEIGKKLKVGAPSRWHY